MKAGTYIFRKTETSGIIKRENKERAASELLHVVEHTTQSLVDGIKTPATITTKTEKLCRFIVNIVPNITPFRICPHNVDDIRSVCRLSRCWLRIDSFNMNNRYCQDNSVKAISGETKYKYPTS